LSALSNSRTRVFGLFLDLDIGIADDPERARTTHLVAGIERGDEQADHILERDEADCAVKIGKPEEPVKRHRQTDQRRHGLVGRLRGQLQTDREAQIGDERERVCRVDRQRGQHREDRLQKLVLEPGHIAFDQSRGPDKIDVLVGQMLLQDRKRGLLLQLQAVDLLEDPVELFAGRQAVGRAVGDAFTNLPFESGDADHEELVEVGGRDRQEPDPLKQRMVDVERFLEHPAVELEPGETPG
jgi:hypothetical protein